MYRLGENIRLDTYLQHNNFTFDQLIDMYRLYDKVHLKSGIENSICSKVSVEDRRVNLSRDPDWDEVPEKPLNNILLDNYLRDSNMTFRELYLLYNQSLTIPHEITSYLKRAAEPVDYDPIMILRRDNFFKSNLYYFGTKIFDTWDYSLKRLMDFENLLGLPNNLVMKILKEDWIPSEWFQTEENDILNILTATGILQLNNEETKLQLSPLLLNYITESTDDSNFDNRGHFYAYASTLIKDSCISPVDKLLFALFNGGQIKYLKKRKYTSVNSGDKLGIERVFDYLYKYIKDDGPVILDKRYMYIARLNDIF
jgi:hypothetical protein